MYRPFGPVLSSFVEGERGALQRGDRGSGRKVPGEQKRSGELPFPTLLTDHAGQFGPDATALVTLGDQGWYKKWFHSVPRAISFILVGHLPILKIFDF